MHVEGVFLLGWDKSFRTSSLVRVLGSFFGLIPYNLSPSTGSTSATFERAFLNFSLVPLFARSSRYACVRNADTFSVKAEFINWLIDTLSLFASSLTFL